MKVRQYKDILLECLVTLRHARTFVTSREKMHRTGIELYDNLIVEVAEALSAPEPALPATLDCDHKFRCNRHRDNPSNECCACGASQETSHGCKFCYCVDSEAYRQSECFCICHRANHQR